MKTLTKYIGLLLGVFAVAACTDLDYPDRFVATSGLPTVDFIRYADKDVIIEQANMEEVICIVGDNLTSVHDLYFNDQPAVLNSSYMTAHTLVVSVPKNMPVEQTDKIYFYNKAGEVYTYDFKVLPPAPKIEGMSFEWAEPGETVTFTGNYFIEPLRVQFPGAEATQISHLTTTSFDVIVPEGAQPGKIKVTTDSGTAQSAFMYKDTRGMLFNFDNARGNHGWHAMTIETGANALDGNYLLLYGTGANGLKADGTDWPDTGYHFEYWPGNWNTPETFDDPEGIDLTAVADFSDWKNLALKFEIMIPAENPWTGTPMQIYFAGHDLVTLQTANNTYFHDATISLPRALWRPWKASGSFDTGGKWITVSFPIASEFVYFWDGTPAQGELKPESFTGFEIFLAAGDSAGEGAPCEPKIHIDNIRVVPIK